MCPPQSEEGRIPSWGQMLGTHRGTGIPGEVESLQTRNTFTAGFGVTAEKTVLFLNEVPAENDVLPLLCIFPANPARGKPSLILP